MKKLNLYTIFALLLMTRSVAMYAQEYVPIIQEGNVWNTLDVTAGMYNTYYNNVNWFSGDTIIDDVRYAKLMGTTDGDAPHLFSLLREDDGKVWERLNNQREILLYDFTANVGDTLWCGLWADEYHYNIVDSISIEHIGGVDRKKFWFGLEYGWFGTAATEIWIEGIGSDLGLLYSGSAGISGAYYCTLCFHQNDELIWQNPNYDDCTFDAVGENSFANEIFVCPNPAKDVVNINFADDTECQSVAIYSIDGRLVVETFPETSQSSTINIADLTPGLYLIKLRMSDGSEFIERIVKE